MANRLEGKVAAITGGDQGIGRAIAERLAAEGADVALCYRSNKAGADEVAASVQKTGRKAAAVQCDVGRLRRASASWTRPSDSWATSTSWSITPG